MICVKGDELWYFIISPQGGHSTFLLLLVEIKDKEAKLLRELKEQRIICHQGFKRCNFNIGCAVVVVKKCVCNAVTMLRS